MLLTHVSIWGVRRCAFVQLETIGASPSSFGSTTTENETSLLNLIKVREILKGRTCERTTDKDICLEYTSELDDVPGIKNVIREIAAVGSLLIPQFISRR